MLLSSVTTVIRLSPVLPNCPGCGGRTAVRTGMLRPSRDAHFMSRCLAEQGAVNKSRLATHSVGLITSLRNGVETNPLSVLLPNVSLLPRLRKMLARLQTWRALIFSRVCLSVCMCVSDGHFYPLTLTDFDETWSQGPYGDLVWPRP